MYSLILDAFFKTGLTVEFNSPHNTDWLHTDRRPTDSPRPHTGLAPEPTPHSTAQLPLPGPTIMFMFLLFHVYNI